MGATFSKMKTKLTLCLLVALALAGCSDRKEKAAAPARQVDFAAVEAPRLNADSIQSSVETMAAFGVRTPGGHLRPAARGWDLTASYIERQMRRWCDTVILQNFRSTLWDGREVEGRNIIASLNPAAERRVLLAAHWDSRLWADHDPDEANWHSPVPGVGDGLSGTAALFEMARAMRLMPPSVGVDFVFFDLEDQGVPEWSEVYADNSWCLGSQHWGQSPHTPFYRAVYGVLFDMIGCQQPRFTKEEVSRHFAPGLTDKLWSCAAQLGMADVFADQKTGAILDDHLYVNQLTGIPMVDIVQNGAEGSFFPHWHTTTDDLAHFSAATVASVAGVVMKVIYADFPAQP